MNKTLDAGTRNQHDFSTNAKRFNAVRGAKVEPSPGYSDGFF